MPGSFRPAGFRSTSSLDREKANTVATMYRPLISACLSKANSAPRHALPDLMAPMAGPTFNSFDHIR
jgi:hypothetical protein